MLSVVTAVMMMMMLVVTIVLIITTVTVTVIIIIAVHIIGIHFIALLQRRLRKHSQSTAAVDGFLQYNHIGIIVFHFLCKFKRFKNNSRN